MSSTTGRALRAGRGTDGPRPGSDERFGSLQRWLPGARNGSPGGPHVAANRR